MRIHLADFTEVNYIDFHVGLCPSLINNQSDLDFCFTKFWWNLSHYNDNKKR